MQMGAEIRQSVTDVNTDSLLSQNWPPSPSKIRWRSCSETESATTDRNGRKKQEKNAWNATEFLISVDLGKVWPPLVCIKMAKAVGWQPGRPCRPHAPKLGEQRQKAMRIGRVGPHLFTSSDEDSEEDAPEGRRARVSDPWLAPVHATVERDLVWEGVH